MAQQVSSKDKGRYYVRNVSKGFLVPYLSFDIEQETTRLIDKLNLDSGRNEDLEIGDEIEVVDQKNTDQKIFGGYITSIEETDNVWKVEVDEYVREVVDKSVKKVYRDRSPEYILEDLIANETSLSFSAPVSSGVTIGKYVVEGKIEQAVKDMTDVLDWQARTTPQREFFFEPRGRIDSNITLEHGRNAVVTNKKTKDSKFINTVELRAGRTNYDRSNSFTGDGSTKTFALTEVPAGSVSVTVDGVDQTGAIAEDLRSGDDFYIDTDGPSLVFASAPADGASISINYTYEVPILVEATAENAKIPASEREISTTIKRKWIKKFRDAREYAKNYVENHSRLIGEVKLTRPYNSKPPVGHLARVIDNNKGIDANLVVERKNINQDAEMTMKLGQQDFNAIEWRNAVQRRIKELERSQTTNKVLTKFLSFDGTLDFSTSLDFAVKKREVNDSFILGNTVNGVVSSGNDRIVIDDFET